MSVRTNIKQIVNHVREGVSDMSYAQRRVFENLTGVAARGHDRRHDSSGHGRGPLIATSPRELEALYAQDVKTGWR